MPTTPDTSLRPPTSRRDDVQAFLDRFARALTAGDGATIATMWQIPAYVLGDHGPMAVSSVQEVEAFFGGAKDQYNERGIVDTRGEIVDERWVTDRICIVEVRWPWYDADGHVRGEERSTYTLRRDDDGALKLAVSVMHGATEPS